MPEFRKVLTPAGLIAMTPGLEGYTGDSITMTFDVAQGSGRVTAVTVSNVPTYEGWLQRLEIGDASNANDRKIYHSTVFNQASCW